MLGTRDAYAIDFGLNYSEVRASAYGTAHPVPGTTGYGNFIWIQHNGGYVSLYAHLSAFAVSDGQTVAKGQRIGTSGSTGTSSGPHLHFRVTSGASSPDTGSAYIPEPMSGVAPPGYTGFDRYGCGTGDTTTTFTSTPPNQQIGVSRRSDGTLDLLIRGLDGVAYHAPTDRSGTPLYWESLQLTVKGTPSGVWDGVANRLDVYAIGINDDHPYHDAFVGGSWSGWAQQQQAGLSGSSETEQVNVDKRPDGTIDLFLRGQDGAAWHEITDSNGTVVSSESLGGIFKGTPSAVWILQTLHVYAIGLNDQPYHNTWVGGAWSGWAGPQNGVVAKAETEAVMAVRRPAGIVDLFVLGTDGNAWHEWTDTNGIVLTGERLAGSVKGAPDGQWDADQTRLDLYGIGLDDQIWSSTFQGTGWGPWVQLPNAISG